MITTEEKDKGLCLYLIHENFLMLLPACSSLGTEERRRPFCVVLEVCGSRQHAYFSVRTVQLLNCERAVAPHCSQYTMLALQHSFQYYALHFVLDTSLVPTGCWTSDFEHLDHLHHPLDLLNIANFNRTLTLNNLYNILKVAILWNVMPCSLVDNYQCFAGNATSIFRVVEPVIPKREAAFSSEILVSSALKMETEHSSKL